MTELPSPTEKRVYPDRISPSELLQILRADKFLSALAIAADETSRSGYESGFYVDLTESLEVVIPEVGVGGTDSFQAYKVIAKLDGDNHLQSPHASVVDFHFHPEDSGPIIPSDADLVSIQKSKSGAYAVGQVANQNRARLLLMIPKHKSIVTEDIATYAKIIDTEFDAFGTPQPRVQKALEEVGIYSSLFYYDLKNGRYVPTIQAFPDESMVSPIRLDFRDPRSYS